MKLNFIESDEINNTIPNFPKMDEKEFFFTEDQSEFKDLSKEKKEMLKELGVLQWNEYKNNVNNFL